MVYDAVDVVALEEVLFDSAKLEFIEVAVSSVDVS